MKNLPRLALLLLAAAPASRAEPLPFPLILAPSIQAPSCPALAPLPIPLLLACTPALPAAPLPSPAICIAAGPAPAH